jgi:hypothetical protein
MVKGGKESSGRIQVSFERVLALPSLVNPFFFVEGILAPWPFFAGSPIKKKYIYYSLRLALLSKGLAVLDVYERESHASEDEHG